jgi:hypothetical protein
MNPIDSVSFQSRYLLLAPCAALVLHLVGNPHYGFFRDELYFIMCGFRPAWGYVDQPPLAPLLAAASQFFGSSLFLLRAIPALFSAGSIYVTCLLAKEMGGKTFAQVFAALVAFFCPVLMNFGMKVSPDMVGLLLWPLSALLLLRLVKGGKPRYWLLVGLTLGLSFQAKYSVVFFAFALFVGLLLTSHRKILLNPWCIAGAAIGIAVALPNILWQLHFDFPMLELLQNGQKGKNKILSPAEFVAAQLLITNPILASVWIVGLIHLLRNSLTRFLGYAFLVLMIEMIIMRGKHYYPANIYPVVIAAGGVAIEMWTIGLPKLRPWIVGVATTAGLILVPYMMPILPVETFVRFNGVVASILPLDAAKTENHADGILPQDWADMHGWPELAEKVAEAVRSLAPEERAKAVIVARNYGQAAAIEFFGRDYDLPLVVSGHNQYFLWGTHGKTGDVLIDVDGDCGEDIQLYSSSTLATTFTHPYVMPYENNLTIRICRGINQPLAQVWPGLRYYR